MSTTNGTRTRTSALADQLRADIIDGTLLPGERLKLASLGDRYNVGHISLREALSRLASNGLVVITDQKGFSVSRVSRDDYVDLIETRIELDKVALRHSIERACPEWEGRIAAARHKLSRVVEPAGAQRRELGEPWERAHGSFHDALVSGCTLRWLLALREILLDQTARYRRLSLEIEMGPRDIQGEHDAIADAVLRHDADEACALLAAHLRRTSEILLAAGFPEAQLKQGKTRPANGTAQAIPSKINL